jgi:hypothetical protein
MPLHNYLSSHRYEASMGHRSASACDGSVRLDSVRVSVAADGGFARVWFVLELAAVGQTACSLAGAA